MIVIDKRDLGPVFRGRLRSVLGRFDGNQADFADSIGLDRSALSQLLSKDVVRLPRAETLYAIAHEHGISLDWLMGLHDDDDKQYLPALEIEAGQPTVSGDLLAKWYREASGHKIRYVPSTLPFPYRTKAVEAYERTKYSQLDGQTKWDTSKFSWFDKGLPEDTEMDICMPAQQLRLLAEGRGFWQNLERGARQAQMEHLADMLDRDYPTVRLYVYCELACYSIPYAQYGPDHAMIYTGGSYLIVNDADHVRRLKADFDNLIRRAVTTAGMTTSFIRDLDVT